MKSRLSILSFWLVVIAAAAALADDVALRIRVGGGVATPPTIYATTEAKAAYPDKNKTDPADVLVFEERLDDSTPAVAATATTPAVPAVSAFHVARYAVSADKIQDVSAGTIPGYTSIVVSEGDQGQLAGMTLDHDVLGNFDEIVWRWTKATGRRQVNVLFDK